MKKESIKETVKFVLRMIGVAASIYLLLVFLIWLAVKDTEYEVYYEDMIVIDKCEGTKRVNNVALNTATNMPQGTFKSKKDIYVLIVEYDKGENNQGEIEVDKEEYDEIEIGDTISVRISERYSHDNYDSYEMTLEE